MALSAGVVITETVGMTTYLPITYIDYAIKRDSYKTLCKKKPKKCGPGPKSYPLWKPVLFTKLVLNNCFKYFTAVLYI